MKEIILIICFGFLSVIIQGQELISKWSFEKLKNSLVSENTTNKTDQLLGFYDSVSGIKGDRKSVV